MREERAAKRAKAEQLCRLSREQLSTKKLADLKDAVRRLGIPTTGLLEKNDFIQAIVSSKPSERSSRSGERSDWRERFGDGKSEQQKNKNRKKRYVSRSTYVLINDCIYLVPDGCLCICVVLYCATCGSTAESVNLDELLSMDYSQLMKKKVGDLVDIVRGLGIAAKGLLLEKKSDYVRAISEFIKTNKRKWNVDL